MSEQYEAAMPASRLAQVRRCILNSPSRRRLQISGRMMLELMDDIDDWPVIEYDHHGRLLIAGVAIVTAPGPDWALWVCRRR